MANPAPPHQHQDQNRYTALPYSLVHFPYLSTVQGGEIFRLARQLGIEKKATEAGLAPTSSDVLRPFQHQLQTSSHGYAIETLQHLIAEIHVKYGPAVRLEAQEWQQEGAVAGGSGCSAGSRARAVLDLQDAGEECGGAGGSGENLVMQRFRNDEAPWSQQTRGSFQGGWIQQAHPPAPAHVEMPPLSSPPNNNTFRISSTNDTSLSPLSQSMARYVPTATHSAPAFAPDPQGNGPMMPSHWPHLSTPPALRTFSRGQPDDTLEPYAATNGPPRPPPPPPPPPPQHVLGSSPEPRGASGMTPQPQGNVVLRVANRRRRRATSSVSGSANDAKPFGCPECPERFKFLWKLEDHRTRHSGEKNHICDLCNTGFGRARDLVKHISSSKKHAKRLAEAEAALQPSQSAAASSEGKSTIVMSMAGSSDNVADADADSDADEDAPPVALSSSSLQSRTLRRTFRQPPPTFSTQPTVSLQTTRKRRSAPPKSTAHAARATAPQTPSTTATRQTSAQFSSASSSSNPRTAKKQKFTQASIMGPMMFDGDVSSRSSASISQQPVASTFSHGPGYNGNFYFTIPSLLYPQATSATSTTPAAPSSRPGEIMLSQVSTQFEDIPSVVDPALLGNSGRHMYQTTFVPQHFDLGPESEEYAHGNDEMSFQSRLGGPMGEDIQEEYPFGGLDVDCDGEEDEAEAEAEADDAEGGATDNDDGEGEEDEPEPEPESDSDVDGDGDINVDRRGGYSRGVYER